MTAGRLRSLFPILAIMFLFGINLFVLSSIHKNWNTKVKMHFMLEDHLNAMVFDLNIGHLWSKNTLGTTSHSDFNMNMKQHFLHALERNEDVLKTSLEDPFISQQPYIINFLQNFQKELIAFYDIADALCRDGAPCSQNETLFTAFTDLLDKIESINLKLNSEGVDILERLNSTFIMNLAILFAASALMIIMLYLFNRSKKSYQEALNEQKDALSTLSEQSFDGVLMVEGLTIIDCNTSMVNMLEQPDSKELLQTKISQHSPEFQPDGAPSIEKFPQMVKDALTEGHKRFEWMFAKFDGKTFYTEIVITPLSIENKQILHMVIQDITHKKELEASLMHKNTLYKNLVKELDVTVKERTGHMLQQSRLAQMGEMISMIAHQWRQPLGSIAAISGTLTMDIIMGNYKKEFFQERLQAISDLSQHLSSTIDDFRNFFKNAKEKKKTTWKELTEASLNIIGPVLETKMITVHTSFDNKSSIITYPNEVRQVILNIIKNAEDVLTDRKTKDPQIWISSHSNEGNSFLVIEDNGGGIPEDIMDAIFDPYFSTKEKKDGTGLGLYMSKTIIEEHCGGRISCRNTDRGALFQITQPLHKD